MFIGEETLAAELKIVVILTLDCGSAIVLFLLVNPGQQFVIHIRGRFIVWFLAIKLFVMVIYVHLSSRHFLGLWLHLFIKRPSFEFLQCILW